MKLTQIVALCFMLIAALHYLMYSDYGFALGAAIFWQLVANKEVNDD